MRFKLLGKSGLRVSELCLGTMTFGTRNWGTEADEASRIYQAFRERGGNFLDTANEIYAGGRSEEVVGELVQGHREEIVLASKYSMAIPGGANANAGGNHRKSLKRSVESSLRRLGTDYLDVLWVHAWDELTPMEETMRALDDLVSNGKVLYIGISNAPAWVVARCNTLAECKDWTQFVALQAEYNLIERSIEHELLPLCRHGGMTLAAWSPLASGILSGKYSCVTNESKRLDSSPLKVLDESALHVASMVGEIALSLGKSPSQVALNWLRSKPGVIPLIGARTLAQTEDNLGCLDFELDTETVTALDKLAEPQSYYPQDYLMKFKEVISGGFYQRTQRT